MAATFQTKKCSFSVQLFLIYTALLGYIIYQALPPAKTKCKHIPPKIKPWRVAGPMMSHTFNLGILPQWPLGQKPLIHCLQPAEK
jgi:hypothetical protein